MWCKLRQPCTDGHFLGGRRHSSSGAWVSAGDPEATDLSGASAKSGASADSDDDDGAARSPLRPLPARALPPLAALEHADALLNARPDAGAPRAVLVVTALVLGFRGGSTPCAAQSPGASRGALAAVIVGLKGRSLVPKIRTEQPSRSQGCRAQACMS